MAAKIDRHVRVDTLDGAQSTKESYSSVIETIKLLNGTGSQTWGDMATHLQVRGVMLK